MPRTQGVLAISASKKVLPDGQQPDQVVHVGWHRGHHCCQRHHRLQLAPTFGLAPGDHGNVAEPGGHFGQHVLNGSLVAPCRRREIRQQCRFGCNTGERRCSSA